MSTQALERYGTVFPYFIVADAERFVSFLEEVFDAKEISRAEMHGKIANIRLRIGTSTFMISDGAEEGPGAMKGAYFIYVEDADKTFAKLLDSIYPESSG